MTKFATIVLFSLILLFLSPFLTAWITNSVFSEEFLNSTFGGPIGYWQMVGLMIVFNLLFRNTATIGGSNG